MLLDDRETPVTPLSPVDLISAMDDSNVDHIIILPHHIRLKTVVQVK